MVDGLIVDCSIAAWVFGHYGVAVGEYLSRGGKGRAWVLVWSDEYLMDWGDLGMGRSGHHVREGAVLAIFAPIVLPSPASTQSVSSNRDSPIDTILICWKKQACLAYEILQLLHLPQNYHAGDNLVFHLRHQASDKHRICIARPNHMLSSLCIVLEILCAENVTKEEPRASLLHHPLIRRKPCTENGHWRLRRLLCRARQYTLLV